MRIALAVLLAVLLTACASTSPPAGHEAVSLLGQPLAAPAPDSTRLDQLRKDLQQAEAAYAADPHSEDAVVWLGRRTAYLGSFRESIEIYTRGLREHPDSAKLLRHRGHRYITTRQLDMATADFSRAWELVRGKPDETEPDGAPNEKNTPISSLHSNISYHLGLAYYLKGDFRRALAVYRDRMEVSLANDDRLVSTSYWMYLTLRRLGRDAEAATVLERIRPDLNIIENQSYQRLLLLFKGQLKAQELMALSGGAPIENGTVAYGIGCWYWFNGDRVGAERLWRRVVAGKNWPAFGHIAAEAELARLAR